jgi:hypothetical protein
MQIKLIADNNKDLVFSDNLPDALTPYMITGAIGSVASGTFGHVLFQQLQSNGVTIRLHHYILNRSCTFTQLQEEPSVLLRFHINNHIQYHIEGLGNLVFYEQGFNLLHFPLKHNRLHFQMEGIYVVADIHYPVETLSARLPPLVLMNEFHRKVHQLQPAMLIPVNQVASRQLLMQVMQLLQIPPRSPALLFNRAFALLTVCINYHFLIGSTCRLPGQHPDATAPATKLEH